MAASRFLPKDGRLLGVVQLKDIVKGGIRERFAELRRMGTRTVMITRDNPSTAPAVAAEADVDEFPTTAAPRDKRKATHHEPGPGNRARRGRDGPEVEEDRCACTARSPSSASRGAARTTVVFDGALFQEVTRDWYASCGHVDCGRAYGAVVRETFFPVSRYWRPPAPIFASACLAG